MPPSLYIDRRSAYGNKQDEGEFSVWENQCDFIGATESWWSDCHVWIEPLKNKLHSEGTEEIERRNCTCVAETRSCSESKSMNREGPGVPWTISSPALGAQLPQPPPPHPKKKGLGSGCLPSADCRTLPEAGSSRGDERFELTGQSVGQAGSLQEIPGFPADRFPLLHHKRITNLDVMLINREDLAEESEEQEHWKTVIRYSWNKPILRENKCECNHLAGF